MSELHQYYSDISFSGTITSLANIIVPILSALINISSSLHLRLRPIVLFESLAKFLLDGPFTISIL